MFRKFILLFGIISGIIYCYLHVSEGLRNEVQKTTYTTIIAKEHMFMGDVFEISIINFQIVEELEKQPPLMLISVMIDKSMGFYIDPIFPYLRERKPVLDLNAVDNNNVILSPSTAAFKLDFATKSFTAIPHSSKVNLYTSESNICTDDKILLNQTSEIRMTSLKSNGSLLYNLTFVLFIDSKDLEGNYKLHLHSFENSPMTIKLKGAMENWISVWCIFFAFVFIYSCFIVHIIITHTRYLYTTEFWIFPIFCCYWLFNLFESEPFHCKVHEVEVGSITDIIWILMSYDFFVLAITMYFGVSFWNRGKYTGLGYKIDKVFHVFVWLSMMIHSIIQSYNKFSDVLTYSYSTERVGVFAVGAISNNIMIRYVTNNSFMLVHNLCVMTDLNWKKYLGTKGYRTVFWQCYYSIPLFMITSEIVLPIMISLGIPFHLYWIETAVISILQLLGFKMLIAIHCEYLRFKDDNPEDLAAAG